MNLSSKILAYLRASEVVERARAERNRYDRQTAAAINKELKLIAKRLHNSARQMYNNEMLKAAIAKDPEKAKAYANWKQDRRYLNACKTMRRIEPVILKRLQEEKES